MHISVSITIEKEEADRIELPTAEQLAPLFLATVNGLPKVDSCSVMVSIQEQAQLTPEPPPPWVPPELPPPEVTPS